MDTQNRFDGLGRLFGREPAAQLGRAHVCVIGIGGVGSWTVESLARSGVGTLTLIDLDAVCATNANRQIHTVTDTVGQFKVDVMAERVRGINPACDVRPVTDFFTRHTAEKLLGAKSGIDWIVDAIDAPSIKALLMARARDLGIRLVTVGGAGGRVDPLQIQVSDVTRAKNDPLLAKTRKLVRQRHDFPRGKRKWSVPAVWSPEDPVYPTSDGGVCDTVELGHEPKRLDCATGYGAASFVTGTFGLVAASVVVRELLAQETT